MSIVQLYASRVVQVYVYHNDNGNDNAVIRHRYNGNDNGKRNAERQAE